MLGLRSASLFFEFSKEKIQSQEPSCKSKVLEQARQKVAGRESRGSVESCVGCLERKSPAEEVSQRAARTQETATEAKEGPLEKESTDTWVRKEGGKVWACSREREGEGEQERAYWVLCLKGFHLFSTGRNFRGGLGGGSH